MKLPQSVLLLQVLLMGFAHATSYKHTCPDKCGNVAIPYPFGTEKGCYLNESYYIECDSSTKIPYLNIANSTDLYPPSHPEVIEITIGGQMRVTLPISYSCYDKRWHHLHGSMFAVSTSRFPISSTVNSFMAVGCKIEASIMLGQQPITRLKCQSDCEDYKDLKNRSCQGVGCCKTKIPQGNVVAEFLVNANKSNSKAWDDINCGFAFLVEDGKYNFNSLDLSTMRNKTTFPVVLNWSVGNTTCEEAQKDNVTYMCQENSVCCNGEGGLPGYRCKCSEGYRGNPYIPHGCQDVNECDSAELNIGGKCRPVEHKSESISIMKGISEGVVSSVVVMIFVYWVARQRIRIKGRNDFFKQNGGIMLQKALFTCKDSVNKAKIFTEEEMKKATNNFDEANVIGQGGYGTVYKGVLANKTLVAIKKSKLIDQSQIKQFVNEVIILSQINHQNIVKLLGCCLETYVPLLVYEYITNNNLRHHIHTHATLKFGKRLKIATEIAEALAYMHSTTNIIHRDVKPSNILLNHEFTAKVSDFGISTFVPLGQTHLSTFVKGTIGYMDPEYFRTCKLTEKSDVYSFGVVLLELLTGTEIHSLEISLTVYRGAAAYLASLLEHNTLVQVLDDQLKRDEYSEVVKSVAKIAISCLDLEGKTRPTMVDVKQELQHLRCVLLSVETESI